MGLTGWMVARSGNGGLCTCSEGGSGGWEDVGEGFTEEDREVPASDQLDIAELTWLELARECSWCWEWPEDGLHAVGGGLDICLGGMKWESGFT